MLRVPKTNSSRSTGSNTNTIIPKTHPRHPEHTPTVILNLIQDRTRACPNQPSVASLRDAIYRRGRPFYRASIPLG